MRHIPSIVLVIAFAGYIAIDLLTMKAPSSTGQTVINADGALKEQLDTCTATSEELAAQRDAAIDAASIGVGLVEQCIEALERYTGKGEGEVNFGNEGPKYDIAWEGESYVHTYELSEVRNSSQSY